MIIVLFAGWLALASRLDHIPPVKRTFIYLSINHRINSGLGWSIYTGERWSGSPAFTVKRRTESIVGRTSSPKVIFFCRREIIRFVTIICMEDSSFRQYPENGDYPLTCHKEDLKDKAYWDYVPHKPFPARTMHWKYHLP